MNEDQTDQATKPAEVRVPYGDRPHQTLALPIAEAMLRRWAATSPSTFGTNLRAVTMADLNGGR